MPDSFGDKGADHIEPAFQKITGGGKNGAALTGEQVQNGRRAVG